MPAGYRHHLVASDQKFLPLIDQAMPADLDDVNGDAAGGRLVRNTHVASIMLKFILSQERDLHFPFDTAFTG